MKDSARLVIWPANIDARKPLREGRRIPKSAAVESPRIQELFRAAQTLSLNPEAVEGAAQPSSWWEKTGYIWVEKKKPRTEILREVAHEIKNVRKTQLKK